MDTVYITFLIGIILWCVIGNPVELFMVQPIIIGKSKVNPQYILPPGYTNMNYNFKNSKKPIWSKTDYCNDNPGCYPCYGWTKIGSPECLQR